MFSNIDARQLHEFLLNASIAQLHEFAHQYRQACLQQSSWLYKGAFAYALLTRKDIPLQEQQTLLSEMEITAPTLTTYKRVYEVFRDYPEAYDAPVTNLYIVLLMCHPQTPIPEMVKLACEYSTTLLRYAYRYYAAQGRTLKPAEIVTLIERVKATPQYTETTFRPCASEEIENIIRQVRAVCITPLRFYKLVARMCSVMTAAFRRFYGIPLTPFSAWLIYGYTLGYHKNVEAIIKAYEDTKWVNELLEQAQEVDRELGEMERGADVIQGDSAD
ncbi:MAG: hypothetical protein QXV23_05190 [Candidatus Bathyarchaeia archaeon]